MTQPVENLIAKFIANRVGRDYEHIDVMLALSLMDYLKEEGWEITEIAPEVEVTSSRSSVHVAVPETPVAARRSGAKNVSDPHLQTAFISEARRSMGQPSLEDAWALVDKRVTLVFNVDKAPVTGVLTNVTQPSAGPGYVMLDNETNLMYPLNSIQQIKEAP